MDRFADPNPDYWDDYGPFQRVKHELIRAYLGAGSRSSGPGRVGSCTSIPTPDVGERMNQAVRLLARKIGAAWWTYVRMTSGGEATRYILLHLTNHEKGRDLMKDCIWSILPDGGFEVMKSEDPRQLTLITREPDLKPLRDPVLEKIGEKPRRWSELEAVVRDTLWRPPHLNRTIKALCHEGVVAADGMLTRRADPLLRIVGPAGSSRE